MQGAARTREFQIEGSSLDGAFHQQSYLNGITIPLADKNSTARCLMNLNPNHESGELAADVTSMLA